MFAKVNTKPKEVLRYFAFNKINSVLKNLLDNICEINTNSLTFLDNLQIVFWVSNSEQVTKILNFHQAAQLPTAPDLC